MRSINSILHLFFLLNIFAPIQLNATTDALPDSSLFQINTEWTDQSSKKLKLSSFRGHYLVVSMVYLGCQSSCPLTIARMKEVEKHLSAEMKSNVKFILFTFDLKKDTPAVMLKYAGKNKLDLANWNFLTTKDESDMREISTLIDFKYKSLPSGEFEHSYALVLLDPEGRIIGRTEGSEMNPKSLSDLIQKQK